MDATVLVNVTARGMLLPAWWMRQGFCFALFSQSPGLCLLICNQGIVRALLSGHPQDRIRILLTFLEQRWHTDVPKNTVAQGACLFTWY